MNSSYLLRLLLVFTGTMIAGVGIQVIVSSAEGVDSLSTFILGLMNHASIPFGRWSQILSVTFLVITFFYKKELLGIGSVVNALLLGQTIQMVSPFIDQIEFLKGNYFTTFLGFVIFAFGTALYLVPNLGAGPLEGMMFTVCDLLKLPLNKGRILLDFVIVAAGVLLGSKIGVGTVFAIFLLGPMIQWFLEKMAKLAPQLSVEE